jgi:hypothetical protein
MHETVILFKIQKENINQPLYLCPSITTEVDEKLRIALKKNKATMMASKVKIPSTDLNSKLSCSSSTCCN